MQKINTITQSLNIYCSNRSVRKLCYKFYNPCKVSLYDVYISTSNNILYIHNKQSDFALQCRLGSNKNILFCTNTTRDLDLFISGKFIKLESIKANCGNPEEHQNFIFHKYSSIFSRLSDTNEKIYVWDTCMLMKHAGHLNDVFDRIFTGQHIILEHVRKELEGLSRNESKKGMVSLIFRYLRNNKNKLVYFKDDDLASGSEADPYIVEFCKGYTLLFNQNITCLTRDKGLITELKQNSIHVINEIK